MPAKILIVDDEPSACQTLDNLLFPEGYELQFASNGLEGLELARTWQPDVILSDVMMSGMDGLEFCRRVRADANLGQVPIILITALNDRQAKLNGLQAGADDFITKPFDALELRARLRTTTRLDRFRKLNDERLKLEETHRELLQAHEALRANAVRLQNLIETCSDAIFVVDRETGQLILANPAATQMYGYTYDELLQMHSSAVSAEPQKTIGAIRDSVPYIPERLHRRKDGSTFPVEIIGGYFTEQGKKLHTAFIRDITERKQAEEKIAKRNRELKALQAIILDIASSHTLGELLNLIVERACDLLDTSSGGLYLCEPDRQEVRCVVSYHTPYDYTGTVLKFGEGAAGHVAQTGEALIVADYRQWAGRAATFETDQPFERVMSVPLKWEAKVIGVIHALRTGSLPFNQEDLELLELFANHAALTVEQAQLREALEHELLEQKRLGAALRESETYAQAMLNAIPDMMFRLSREGVILEFRTNGHDLYDQRGDLIGKQINDSLPPEPAYRVETYIAAALNTGQLQSFEYLLDYHNTGRREFEARMVPSGDDEVIAIVREITERKQAEGALRASEEQYHAMFATNTAIKLLIDPATGAIIEANQASAAFYGWTVEQLKTMNINQINTLADENIKAEMQLAASQNRTYFVFRHRLASGEIRDVEVHSSPIEIGGRKLLFSIIHDISERKQAETKLRDSEERFRSFIEQSADGFMLSDEQGIIIEWNSALTEITGFRREQAHGMTIWELLSQLVPTEKRSALNAENIKNAMLSFLQTGQSLMLKRPVENEIQIPSGERKFIQQISFPIHTAQGYRVGAVVRDVTKHKAFERKLRENEEKYHSIVSHAVEAIILVDELGVVIEWNEAAEKVTGIPAREVLGQHAWDVQMRLVPPELRTPEYAEKVARGVEEALLTGQGPLLGHFASQITHLDGKQYYFDQATFAIPTAHGFRICIMTHDVTSAKEAEKAIRAAHDELEQKVRARTAELQETNLALEKASRAKDEFMATMNHELRTPLTGILGMAEVLQLSQYGVLSEKQRKAVVSIEKSGKRLLETVSNVLDYTVLQSEKISSRPQTYPIASLCLAALQTVKPLAEARQQQSYFTSVPDQIMFQTDEQHFNKLLRHLLNNASKFTPEKGEFGIEVRGEKEKKQVKVTVWDKGIGIQPQDFPQLFKPFTQLDATLTRRYEGAGLGLALAKQLAQVLGGSIDVTSVVDEGSRITITFPWEQE